MKRRTVSGRFELASMAMRGPQARRRRLRLRHITLGLALATVALVVPSTPASASLPPFYCERDGSLIFCVEFDGVRVRAGAGAPAEVTWPFTRARVEIVYYD